MLVIKLFSSLLVGTLFQSYVSLWLQVHDLFLNMCQLLLTVSKGPSDRSGSTTKVFAQFPFQVLGKFSILEFKLVKKP